MSLGHGDRGLADRLRSYLDLAADPNAKRQPRLELQLGKSLGSWSVHAGSVYKTTISAASITFAGVIRAVVGVESIVAPRPLIRVERLADVVAGTWFYDESAQSAGGSVDLYARLPNSSDPSGASVIALLFFGFGIEGEVNPILGREKSADPGFEAWTTGTDLTSWNEQGVGATFAVTQETANVVEGASAVRLASIGAGLAAGTNGGANSAPHVLVAGQDYLVSVAYWTSVDLHPDLSARLRIRETPVTDSMLEDGLSTTSSTAGTALRPTFGEWKRAFFRFRSPWDTTTAQAGVRLHNAGAGAASGGYVLFDDFHFWPIIRDEFYAPGLSADSIPEREVMSQGILFGAKTMGIGGVSILDGDGDLTKAFAQLLVFNKPAFVYSGGQFPNGEEVYRDDWRAAFPAFIRKPTYPDGKIALELEDARTLTRAQALTGAHRIADAANLNPVDEGKPKPYVFGETTDYRLKGIRVDVDSNGYGSYELLDPRVPVADGVSVGLPAGYTLKTYPNKELADLDEKGRVLNCAITSSSAANPSTITTPVPHRLVTGETIIIAGHSNAALNTSKVATVVTATTFTVPTAGGYAGGTGGTFVNTADFDVVNNNTRWHVKRDIRNYRYDKAGNEIGAPRGLAFDFDIGAGALVALVNPDGPAHHLAADLAAAMNTAAAVADITVTYDQGGGGNPHKWTVAKGAGNLNLRMIRGNIINLVGKNSHQQAWKYLGFDTGSDRTGALSYLGDQPTFISADADHILRFVGGGYMDDAAGSICGVASAALDSAPAVASWLLQKVLSQPPANVDVAGTFKAARLQCLSSDFSQLFMFIEKGEASVFEVLSICERVGLMDLVLDGARSDGAWKWVCKKWTISTVGAVPLGDNDFLSWEMWQEPAALFREVRIYGDYHPARGRFNTWADAGTLDPGMAVKHGAEAIFELDAYLTRSVITGGLQLVSGYYGSLISMVPRVARFGVRGKLINKLIGDKVLLTRSRAFDATGALAGVAFRIIGLRHNDNTGVSTCTAVEDVDFT